jgi:hypothetical protein
MISALGSSGDVAKTVAPKKHDMFYRKNAAIKSPHEVSRHQKKAYRRGQAFPDYGEGPLLPGWQANRSEKKRCLATDFSWAPEYR